jgi:hypothetical protein
LNAAVVDLFWRWLLIGALAFGGGQAALSLVERTTVTDTGWISAGDCSTAVAFSFVTPGPVLILATFIGYRVAGIAGAVAATIGVFLARGFSRPPRRSGYSMALPPGNYRVELDRRGIDRSMDLPRVVTITTGQATRLDVSIDTGIR